MKKFVAVLLAVFAAVSLGAEEYDADYYYSIGSLFYFQFGDIDTGIKGFTDAINIDPEYANAYLARGDAYDKKGESYLAIEDFSRYIALKPEMTIGWNSRGGVYLKIGEYNKAINDFIKAIEINPNYYSAWFNLGNTYWNTNDLEQSINAFSKALAINPNSHQAWSNRGNVYYSKDELDFAIADCSKSIELNSREVFPWYIRGNAYSAKGEYDLAIADFNRAISLNNNFSYAWDTRGTAYFRKGEMDRALEDYNMAIALSPNYAVAWNNRGNVFLIKGEYDKAVEDYSQAIILDPDYTFPWSNRGNVFMVKGDYDRAIEDYNMAISINPNAVLAWVNRGQAYKRKGNLIQAIDDFNKAIIFNPYFVDAYYNRGMCYAQIYENDSAINDFTRVININSNNYLAYYYRGVTHFRKENLSLAIEDFRDSIEAADRSSNILDIFNLSWKFIEELYDDFPFLDNRILNNDFNIQFIALTREGLNRSIAKAENVRSNLGSRGIETMNSIIYLYYAGVDFEANFGSKETLFAYSEKLRSRGFLEQLGTEEALKLPGISNTDAQDVRNLIREIDNLKESLARLNPQIDVDKYAEVGFILTRMEEALTVLDTSIVAKVPRYAMLRSPNIVSLAEAQAFCGDDTVILEYVLWDSSQEFTPLSTIDMVRTSAIRMPINSYCLVITKNSITSVRLDSNFDFITSVNELRRLIINRRAINEMEPLRNSLYAALIKPVLEYIPYGIKNITIVPDGTLGTLPFDILRENPSSSDLGITYRLSFSPSVSVSILATQTELDAYEPLMALGGAWYNKESIAANRGERGIYSFRERGQRDIITNFDSDSMDWDTLISDSTDLVWTNLPGTELEVHNLLGMVSSHAQILMLTGEEVSEQKLKQLSENGVLSQYSVIHFACHGYFNEADPYRSGIVLSEVSGLLDNEEDGYLTIPEIAILNLQTRMVLLSACETGRTVLKRGDGMVGMARAFMVAGAENVGVSFWSISDEGTVEFMTRLYEKVLKDGYSFQEAYYQVKQELRGHERWNHPFFWAAFNLYK